MRFRSGLSFSKKTIEAKLSLAHQRVNIHNNWMLYHRRNRPARGVFESDSVPTLVFTTVCAKGRKQWLTNPQVHAALQATWRRHGGLESMRKGRMRIGDDSIEGGATPRAAAQIRRGRAILDNLRTARRDFRPTGRYAPDEGGFYALHRVSREVGQ